jgi:hypothetical protein
MYSTGTAHAPRLAAPRIEREKPARDPTRGSGWAPGDNSVVVCFCVLRKEHAIVCCAPWCSARSGEDMGMGLPPLAASQSPRQHRAAHTTRAVDRLAEGAWTEHMESGCSLWVFPSWPGRGREAHPETRERIICSHSDAGSRAVWWRVVEESGDRKCQVEGCARVEEPKTGRRGQDGAKQNGDKPWMEWRRDRQTGQRAQTNRFSWIGFPPLAVAPT